MKREKEKGGRKCWEDRGVTRWNVWKAVSEGEQKEGGRGWKRVELGKRYVSSQPRGGGRRMLRQVSPG